MEIAENIYQVVIGLPFKELGDIRIYYIKDERPVIIDSGPGYGLSHTIFSKLKEMGLGIETAQLLLSTHEHPDHIGGHADVKQANGKIMLGAHPVAVRNYAHMAFPPEVMKDIPIGLRDKYANQFQRVAEIGADFYFEEGSEIDLGERGLKVLHLPGHAPGHVGFYDGERKILFGGDNVTLMEKFIRTMLKNWLCLLIPPSFPNLPRKEVILKFRKYSCSRKYAKKLLPHLNEGWETESIIIENECGIIFDRWVAEEGKIVYSLMGEVATSQKL